jgi:hypothetical protein
VVMNPDHEVPPLNSRLGRRATGPKLCADSNYRRCLTPRAATLGREAPSERAASPIRLAVLYQAPGTPLPGRRGREGSLPTREGADKVYDFSV